MRHRILTILAALGLAAGVAVATPSMASADAQFGCTSGASQALHMTATRLNYGNNQSAIYASATAKYQQQFTLRPDIVWTFYSFTSSSGLQTRYTQPTQWGSTSYPLDLNTRYITVTWHGRTTVGTSVSPTSCTTRVGV